MPACVTEAPKPIPVDAGSSTSAGTRMNEPNIPKPKSDAVRLVVHTLRCRIIRMSTSGSEERASATTHAAQEAAARTNSARTDTEAQPQAGPSLTATSSATSQVESRADP